PDALAVAGTAAEDFLAEVRSRFAEVRIIDESERRLVGATPALLTRRRNLFCSAEGGVTDVLEPQRKSMCAAESSNTAGIQLLYFTPSDLLVPRVDRQCIMRFLDALVAMGVNVEAVSLDVQLEHAEPTQGRDLFEVYGLDRRFP